MGNANNILNKYRVAVGEMTALRAEMGKLNDDDDTLLAKAILDNRADK